MSLNVQGSNLWFIDPADDSVNEVGCVTTLSGLTADREQNDVTCISDIARRFEAGLLVPGAATFGINFDTADESHVRLHELYRSGTTLKWALGLSDGPSFGEPPPTGVDSAGDFILPTTRSYITFDGYVSSYPFEFAIGAKVVSTIGIQVSDFPELNVKA